VTKVDAASNSEDAAARSVVQVETRECEWCGKPIRYSGKGRPPRYCGPVHRRRAWELRTAQERAGRPVEEGGKAPAPAPPRPAPRPAERLSGQPYTLPEDAVEWIEALAALRREAWTNPRVVPFREHVARACERTARALRADPGETPAL
jgi:hypothetical protein